ncbi:MAG: hypothetical protein R3185_05530, partial [Candidatus Thermoplasmatota archaeon]|nr:hypothetical protein [Candidatus Thermoplasmatota archaeon]
MMKRLVILVCIGMVLSVLPASEAANPDHPSVPTDGDVPPEVQRQLRLPSHPAPDEPVVPNPSEELATAEPYAPEFNGTVPLATSPSDGVAIQASDCGWIRVDITWEYFDEGWSLRPLNDATVKVWDSETGSDFLLRTGVTDINGHYRSGWIQNDDGFLQGKLDIYVTVETATDPGITVKHRFTINPYVSETGTRSEVNPTSTGCVVEFGDRIPDVAQWDEWRVYEAGIWSWKYASSLGTGKMDKVDIYYPDEAAGLTAPHYEWYYPAGEAIAVPEGWDDELSVLYHEHGHVVQDWAYGWNNFPVPFATSHSRCEDNQDLGLAYGEGWANFWSSHVKQRTRDDIRYRGNNIEASWTSCYNVEGPDNEWNVAQAFWDLYDEPADGKDAWWM